MDKRYGDLFFNISNGIVWQKILVLLPVKDLLRFKTVSKSFYAYIGSSFFIDLHTTFNVNNSSSSSSNKFGSFILQASSLDESLDYDSLALVMLSSEEPESVSRSGSESGGCLWSTNDQDDDKPDDDQQQLKVVVDTKLGGVSNKVFKLDSFGFPSDDSDNIFANTTKQIVGSSNGLVCLVHKIVVRNQISLWNPATGHFRNLPEPEFIGNFRRRLAAFGFDVETKDYKVVLLDGDMPMYYREVAPMDCLCQIQVYSLSTDSWRDFQGGITSLPGDPFGCSTEGLWLNGSSCFFLAHFLHTKLRRCIPDNDRFIISFDLTKEIITPIQLPDHHKDQVLYLSCVGVKLALFTVYYDPPRGTYDPEICGCEDYTMWVLDEHVSIISSSSVNKESWTKLHSFQIKHERPSQWYWPRGISKDGEFALLETRGSAVVYSLLETRGSAVLDNNMKLYNLFTKQVEKDFPSCFEVMSRAYAYKPSLVSIDHRGGSSSSSIRR